MQFDLDEEHREFLAAADRFARQELYPLAARMDAEEWWPDFGEGLAQGEGGRGEIHALTAASVLYAAETMNRVLDDAVQIHGGAGYIWESEINRLFRATKLLEIGAGTSEIRKLIIAGELLRK